MREKKRIPPIVKQESLQELKVKKEVIPVSPKRREEVSSHNRSSD
jgi:hypothetical protein